MTSRRLRKRIGSFFTSLTGLLTSTAALLGAVVAILSAIGVIGGGRTRTASTSQSSPSWAAEANAICARANDATNALPNPRTLAPSDAAGYLRTVVVFEDRMLRDLNALPTPKGKQAEVTAFLDIGAKMSDATNELADDVTVGDLPALQRRATLLSQLNTRFNNAATALGARTCAEGSSLSDVFGS
jgi:hypothetical protein